MTKKKSSKPSISVRNLSPRKDMFWVENKDPKFEYYHAADNPVRIRQLELDGYEVCRGDEVVGSPLATDGKPEAGPINLPGHVLMRTPKENKERLEAEKDERLRQHEQDVQDKVDQVRAILERAGLGRSRARLKDDDIQF